MSNVIGGATNGITLLPCQFCSGEAKKSSERFENTLSSWVYCASCGAAGGYRHTEAEAIAAWNSRAERTCRNASYRVDESRFHCSVCGFGCWVRDVSDGRDKLPNYCPNCGARIEVDA